jgi:hypothetical protein
VGPGGAGPVDRLTKRQVEELLTSYDHDPIAALTVALRAITGQRDTEWPDLVDQVIDDPARRAGLLAADPADLDALAAELNELRGLSGRATG